MVEVLTFIFADLTHFIGCLIFLLCICWAISNFRLINIEKNNYKLIPSEFLDNEDEAEGEGEK